MEAERYKANLIAALLKLFPEGLGPNVVLELRAGNRHAVLLVDTADVKGSIRDPLRPECEDGRFLRDCGIAPDSDGHNGCSKESRNRGT